MKRTCVELHLHTNKSFDGSISREEAIKGAKDNNVSMLAFANHNTDEENRELYQEHGWSFSIPLNTYDGIDFIPATEFTGRIDTVLNKDNNTAKMHVLIYGADISDDSPLHKLLKIKRINDRQCDLGLLDYIMEVKNIKNISEDDIRDFMQEKRQEMPGFSSLGKESVWELLNKKGISVFKSYREFSDLCSRAPWHDRLNISVEDIVKVAHASGGIVIMAHPWETLERIRDKSFAVNEILRMDFDGFEIFSPTMTDEIMSIIKNCVRKFKAKNKILYTGGSDMHDFSRGNKIGRIRHMPLYREAVRDFEEEIVKLRSARRRGKMTARIYPEVSREEVDRIIEYYKQAFLYLKDVAEANALGRALKVDKPKKKHNKIKESIKSEKMRPKKKDKRLEGANFDIEDFESVHDYLIALDDLGENSFSKDDKEESYEDYIKQMTEMYSKNNSNMLDDDVSEIDD